MTVLVRARSAAHARRRFWLMLAPVAFHTQFCSRGESRVARSAAGARELSGSGAPSRLRVFFVSSRRGEQRQRRLRLRLSTTRRLSRTWKDVWFARPAAYARRGEPGEWLRELLSGAQTSGAMRGALGGALHGALGHTTRNRFGPNPDQQLDPALVRRGSEGKGFFARKTLEVKCYGGILRTTGNLSAV